MDEQALYAIAVGDGRTSQAYLLAYFEQLKNTDEGWQLSSEVLAKNLYSDEKIKFFLLQVLEHHIKIRYSALAIDQVQKLRMCLMQWFKLCCYEEQKLFIKKKTAQILCLLFVQEYPLKWPTFFEDVMSFIESGKKAAEMYLRILVAIDEEVVARHIPHIQQEMDRNTVIKDTMRGHCVNKLVDSWFNLLKLYDNKDAELTCLCLEVIGVYVSWIDIDLIANDRFISNMLLYLNSEVLRESTCDCFFEIISKGMEPVAKTRLVESLTDALETIGILTQVEGEDLDFVAKVAKLINGMGIQLISSWTKLPRTNGENDSAIILKAIERKIPYLLRFLRHEDDDISETVSEFAHSYLGILKQMKPLSAHHSNSLKNLLCIVINKMKYDEDYNFEQEGEDEAMFLDFRKQMKVLVDNIGKIDGNLVVKTIHEYARQTLQNLDTASYMDTELAIYMIYILGEAIPGQDLYSDAEKFAALQEMMIMLLDSRISWVQHVAVKLQFFETITRYERFFYSQTQYLPNALEAFVDERGLKNGSPRVCSRTSYLLMRFVKQLKNQVRPYVDEVLRRLGDVLVTGEGDSYRRETRLSEDDMNYLYELSATLITCSGENPEGQYTMMNCLLSPVIIRFTNILTKLKTQRATYDEKVLLDNAVELQSLIAFTSRASKAFGSQTSLKSSGCSGCFKEALPVFLEALTTPYHRDIIHSGVRQYLHRMIICLGDELLPFLPVAVTHLLKDCELRDIQEFIPLINQLIARFKGQIVPFLCEVFMPVVNTIFTILNAPLDEADLQAVKDRQTLRRSYFLFICTIANNNVLQIIANLGAEDIKSILFTVVQGAAEFPDPQGQKTCFSILGKVTDMWGNETSWPGFKEFMFDSILPACLLTPLKPGFDLTDGQSFLVIQEIAQTLKTMLERRGQELIVYLQNKYLPQLQCPADVIMEYCDALQNMDVKKFKIFLKEFYSKKRT